MILKDSKKILSQALALAIQWKYFLLISSFAVILIAIVFLPYDQAWLSGMVSVENSSAQRTARFLSLWGDFQTGTCITALTFFLLGKFFKKNHWKRAAIACLLAAVLAGITVNIISFFVGRPRPFTEVKDGFYGVKTEYAFHSFPSGHSATAFGTAAAIAVAIPQTSVPALAIASSIAWSRLSLNRHYPSDIFVGSFLGIVFGILLGCAARKISKDDTTPQP